MQWVNINPTTPSRRSPFLSAWRMAWRQDLGVLPYRTRRRQKLEQYVELLGSLLQHMTLASRLGAA